MSPWTPDTRKRITAAQRFFARLISFDLECPHCGDVYTVRTGSFRSKVGSRKGSAWDPMTARFRCMNKNCGRVYVLGVLAWPIVPAAHVASATPEDQVPSPRQLGQMRKEGGGWWMADEEAISHKRPQETNLTTEEDRPDADQDEEED